MWSRPRGSAHLYMVANSSGGLWYDGIIALAGRIRGYRVFLHHQVYSYLHRWDYRFALLNRVLGPKGAHIALSEEMSDQLRRQYRVRQSIVCVPNTVAVMGFRPNSGRASRASGPLTIGHLSNLSMEKGLGTVLTVFRELRAIGADVRLVLGGPTCSNAAADAAREVVAQFPREVDYLGPIYGSAKERFYESIDVFLFPSTYRNEAQPLVVCESLLAGVPVFAYGLACIPSLIGRDGGLSVVPNDDFVSAVIPPLRALAEDEQRRRATARAAASRGEELRRDATLKLERFLQFICSQSDATEESAFGSTGALIEAEPWSDRQPSHVR